MRSSRRVRLILLALPLLSLAPAAQTAAPTIDRPMVAKIREEGLQRSRVMDTASYIADVLGARLTLSNDMKRAQGWAKSEMERIGLTHVAAEPFMDYGTTWDNEFTSLHLIEPESTSRCAIGSANASNRPPTSSARSPAPISRTRW